MMSTLLLFLALVALFHFFKRFAEEKNRNQYDERQLIYQKKAYMIAAWSVLFFNTLVFVEGTSLEHYISISFVGVANVFLLIAVYAISSILSDAYFARNTKKRFVYFYALFILLQAGFVGKQWVDGDFFRQGQLYLTNKNSTPLLFVLTFVLILLATAYKTWQEKRGVPE